MTNHKSTNQQSPINQSPMYRWQKFTCKFCLCEFLDSSGKGIFVQLCFQIFKKMTASASLEMAAPVLKNRKMTWADFRDMEISDGDTNIYEL
jgi:hypothetical protein